jgi:hypothetical protein
MTAGREVSVDGIRSSQPTSCRPWFAAAGLGASPDATERPVGFDSATATNRGTMSPGTAETPHEAKRRDDEQAREEIRELFARYRRLAGHGVIQERYEQPPHPERPIAEEPGGD